MGQLQTFWDWRAAMNWIFGGISSGTAVAAWLAGVIVFQVTNPTFLAAYWADWAKIAPDALGAVGGSIPSFAVAFVLQIVLGRGITKQN